MSDQLPSRDEWTRDLLRRSDTRIEKFVDLVTDAVDLDGKTIVIEVNADFSSLSDAIKVSLPPKFELERSRADLELSIKRAAVAMAQCPGFTTRRPPS